MQRAIKWHTLGPVTESKTDTKATVDEADTADVSETDAHTECMLFVTCRTAATAGAGCSAASCSHLSRGFAFRSSF